MKNIFRYSLFVLLVGFSFSVKAEKPTIGPEIYNHVLIEDDFSKKSLSKEWGMYKSASTVRDGYMVGITPKEADHPSVNTIRIDPAGDISVSVKFKFAGSKQFNVMYRDKKCKSSHAGHICHVTLRQNMLIMHDGKTGVFRKDIREKRKAKQPLDDATKAMLKTKSSGVKLNLDPKKWHHLEIRIQKDVMETYIDGKYVGRLKSEGIGHARKDQVNLTTNKAEMHYDDFMIVVP